MKLAAALALAALALTASTGVSGATFTASGSNTGNAFTTDPDWRGPLTARATVLRQGAGIDGFVAPGATYAVYAQVSDRGNPPSGTASVTADLSAVTGGASSVTLVPGSWTIAGQAYDYGSAPLTADASLGAGAVSFSVTSTDSAGNTATAAGFSVRVDASAPRATDVQAADGGGTAGQLQAGDTLTLVASEQLDPGSIVAGWDGASPVDCVVHLTRGGVAHDTLTFYDATNTTALALGTVDLGRSDFARANVTFGAGGTPSTIAQAGSTVTIRLGTASGAVKTAKGAGVLVWQPGAALTDPAGNTIVAGSATESGPSDVDF